MTTDTLKCSWKKTLCILRFWFFWSFHDLILFTFTGGLFCRFFALRAHTTAAYELKKNFRVTPKDTHVKSSLMAYAFFVASQGTPSFYHFLILIFPQEEQMTWGLTCWQSWCRQPPSPASCLGSPCRGWQMLSTTEQRCASHYSRYACKCVLE